MVRQLSPSRQTWQRFAQRVIVERRRFTKNAWLPHFRRLRRDIEAYHGALAQLDDPAGEVLDPRELLIWAWCVLMAAPENTAQHYAAIPEAGSDGSGLAEQTRALRRRHYRMFGMETSPEMQMRWLGALVRALDEDLSCIDYWPRRGSAWSAADWQPAGYPCFIVPVRRDYRCENFKERDRRATRYHAVVPAALGDLTIELIRYPDVTPAPEARRWKYGAAVFPGMTLALDLIDEQFLVSGASLGEDAAALIGHQVSTAVDAACDVLVWPELTVPDERLVAIAAALTQDPLGDHRRVALTVAGSWHREAGGGMVNRAPVLNSRGRLLFHYDKRRKFPLDTGEREAIEAGSILPVIVMEDRLVSVAICRDFCDDCADPVYNELGVDLVLVTSLGRESTISAHQRGAKALQSQQGAVTFVVQQVPAVAGHAPAEPPAYSFASPPGPAPTPVADAQSEPIRVLTARR